MPELEFITTSTPASVRKEVTCEAELAAGSKVKMEIGDNELNTTVPNGKVWTVISNVRLIETDA